MAANREFNILRGISFSQIIVHLNGDFVCAGTGQRRDRELHAHFGFPILVFLGYRGVDACSNGIEQSDAFGIEDINFVGKMDTLVVGSFVASDLEAEKHHLAGNKRETWRHRGVLHVAGRGFQNSEWGRGGRIRADRGDEGKTENYDWQIGSSHASPGLKTQARIACST